MPNGRSRCGALSLVLLKILAITESYKIDTKRGEGALGTWGSIGGLMRNAAFGILAAATVVTSGLVPTAALAGTVKPRMLAYSSTAAGGGDPATTVTFAVTTGALSMSAPVAVNLGTGAPGTTISGALGPVTVTDDRALLSASWTVTASSTGWTTGGGTGPETIPASDVGYDPGTITTTGTITVTGTPITLSGTA